MQTPHGSKAGLTLAGFSPGSLLQEIKRAGRKEGPRAPADDAREAARAQVLEEGRALGGRAVEEDDVVLCARHRRVQVLQLLRAETAQQEKIGDCTGVHISRLDNNTAQCTAPAGVLIQYSCDSDLQLSMPDW